VFGLRLLLLLLQSPGSAACLALLVG